MRYKLKFAITISLVFLNIYAKIVAQDSNKLIAEIKDGKRTTAYADWWGFNNENATECLQHAINSGAKQVIVKNMKSPWIVDRNILLISNQEIIFEDGVIIQAKRGAFQALNECLLAAENKENVSLKGRNCIIKMWKEDYILSPYKKSEWRHTLSLISCKNILIEGINFSNSGGDGIYLGRSNKKNSIPYCQDIFIKNVICNNNYRQGLSVISAKNLFIEDSEFTNTSGTNPQAGIDFEPNQKDELLETCVITGCIFKNNAIGLLISINNLNENSSKISIFIINSIIENNRKKSSMIYGGKVPNKTGGIVTFFNNTVNENTEVISKFINLKIGIQ